MSLYYRKKVKPVLTLFFSLSALFTAAAANGTAAEPVTGGLSVLISGAVLTFIHLLAYSVINYAGPSRFPVLFLVSGLVIIVTVLIAGFTVSGDFLKSAFLSAGQLFMISLYRKNDIYREDGSKRLSRSLILTAFIILIAAVVWMLVLGYFIFFRGMPGSRQWMLFNLYSAVNILIAIDAILMLHNSLNTHVRISRTGIRIDDQDYSNLLSQGDLRILSLFARSEERKLNCARILQDGGGGHQCTECIGNRHKATLCSDYRRIYNQINKLKKFLETMNIATILPPENKREITRKGWYLRMFENTRLHSD